jgi:hypothetical protein
MRRSVTTRSTSWADSSCSAVATSGAVSAGVPELSDQDRQRLEQTLVVVDH